MLVQGPDFTEIDRNSGYDMKKAFKQSSECALSIRNQIRERPLKGKNTRDLIKIRKGVQIFKRNLEDLGDDYQGFTGEDCPAEYDQARICLNSTLGDLEKALSDGVNRRYDDDHQVVNEKLKQQYLKAFRETKDYLIRICNGLHKGDLTHLNQNQLEGFFFSYLETLENHRINGDQYTGYFGEKLPVDYDDCEILLEVVQENLDREKRWRESPR